MSTWRRANTADAANSFWKRVFLFGGIYRWLFYIGKYLIGVWYVPIVDEVMLVKLHRVRVRQFFELSRCEGYQDKPSCVFLFRDKLWTVALQFNSILFLGIVPHIRCACVLYVGEINLEFKKNVNEERNTNFGVPWEYGTAFASKKKFKLKKPISKWRMIIRDSLTA